MIVRNILVLDILGDVLEAVEGPAQSRRRRAGAWQQFDVRAIQAQLDGVPLPVVLVSDAPVRRHTLDHVRSEERRVGKEGSSRWSPYHSNKDRDDKSRYHAVGSCERMEA